MAQEKVKMKTTFAHSPIHGQILLAICFNDRLHNFIAFEPMHRYALSIHVLFWSLAFEFGAYLPRENRPEPPNPEQKYGFNWMREHLYRKYRSFRDWVHNPEQYTASYCWNAASKYAAECYRK